MYCFHEIQLLLQVESSGAKQSECLKYRLHVEEIDKITSLLLGLSGRLARTENSLASFEASAQHIHMQGHNFEEKVQLAYYVLLVSKELKSIYNI